MRGGRELQKYANATGSVNQGVKNTNKQAQDSHRVMNRLEVYSAVTVYIITE